MKKTILGTLVVFLTLALLIGSLTMIGPIHPSSAAEVHDCIKREWILTADNRVITVVSGKVVIHDNEPDPNHFFTCLSVL